MPYENNAPRYNNNPRPSGNYPKYGGPQAGNNRNAAAKKKADAQTDGIILTNEKAGKFLKTRYWSRCLGLDIGTYPPSAQVTYETIRNAQVFGHVFSFTTIYELCEICEEVLESIKRTNTFESTATEAGQKKDVIVEISNGSNINMAPGIYLVIYKSVDSGKRTNILDMYPFSSTKVLRNYDHNTGSAKEDIRATGDFKKFVMCLREAAKAFTMAQAHTVSEISKNDRFATIEALAAISAGLGIDIHKSIATATSGGSRTTGQASYSRDNQQKNTYQRQSQPGQWNRGGQYGQQSGYQQQQQALAAISDEPVDINLDAATLQNVDINSFK